MNDLYSCMHGLDYEVADLRQNAAPNHENAMHAIAADEHVYVPTYLI